MGIRPHLTHLFMEVGDLEKAKRFWLDALGLQLLDDRGAYIAVGGNGGFAMGIEQAPSGTVSPDGPEITLRVDDVDAAVEHLEQVGIKIDEGPADQPWQARHAWLRDPDGRRMSIYSTDTPTMAMKSVEEG